ncbi:hypothetical protein K9B35_19310 [Sphingomonas sp. R647]|uniref:hypothetical protein n=1 Tax=Sphingomonas sp. R647 TaxID=2875233 RepID=UPI001CD51B42|nr:hypothetical protein [Sphingomonas sp. R647]MCA1200121.1 hypothetical protein [Sphingomonas sp. R647]
MLLTPPFAVFYSDLLTLKEVAAYVGDAIYFRAMKIILHASGASELILTVSYSHYPVIAAARSIGMTVCELQHGAVSPCHIGYSGSKHIYFPDVFVPLDETWRSYISRTPIPFDAGKIERRWIDQIPIIGPMEFCRKFRHLRVLVIGQETVHDALYGAYRQLKALGISIEYRFHPRMKESQVPLEEQVAQCSVLIGCYSTVLVEYADTKTIIVVDALGSDFLDVLRGFENVYRLKSDNEGGWQSRNIGDQSGREIRGGYD